MLEGLTPDHQLELLKEPNKEMTDAEKIARHYGYRATGDFLKEEKRKLFKLPKLDQLKS